MCIDGSEVHHSSVDYDSVSINYDFSRRAGKSNAKSLAHLCPEQSQKEPAETPHMVLIGDAYYLSEPKWRVVARLGHLPEAMIDAYSRTDKD